MPSTDLGVFGGGHEDFKRAVIAFDLAAAALLLLARVFVAFAAAEVANLPTRRPFITPESFSADAEGKRACKTRSEASARRSKSAGDEPAR